MSTVPTVMSAFRTLLVATLSTDWQVIYGSREAVTLTSNYVAVIRGAVGRDELLTMERASRGAEAYAMKLELSGSISGAGDETLQTVTEAVFAAKTLIEHAVREHASGPDLGLSASNVMSVTPGDWEFTPGVAPNGDAREALIRQDFNVIGQNT